MARSSRPILLSAGNSQGVRAVFVVKIHADLDERPALGRERCDELRVLFAGDGGLGMHGALCRFSELRFHAPYDGDDFEAQRAVFSEKERTAARLSQRHQRTGMYGAEVVVVTRVGGQHQERALLGRAGDADEFVEGKFGDIHGNVG